METLLFVSIFLAAIAALYVTMSVCRMVGLQRVLTVVQKLKIDQNALKDMYIMQYI